MTWPIAAGQILLDKYRVERVLGQGGMGIVVAVRHIELGELFAMKFLLPEALAHPDAVERFLREARASARLKGEHVVRVQDVGRLPDGMPYMVMEHLAGSDLKHVLAQRGPLPVPEALTYVLQACEALAEAHAAGIVHRDLKPANMFLIPRRNRTPCVKVLDFGISKQMERESVEQQALTRTGMVLGSPLYMSPEQMLRTKEADPRGDIWSMGVVLHELLTGTLPFVADVLTELVGKVLQETPPPPSHSRPEIPPDVDAIVMTCLRKRREERFQTVDQLMDALQAALSRSAAAGSQTGTLLLGAGALSAAPEPRPSQPSRPDFGSGPLPTLPAPAFSVSSTGPGLGPSSLVAMPAAGAQTGQTGQTWGTTARPQAAGAPKRAGMAIAGAALGLLVFCGGALAAWRYGKDSAVEGTPVSAAAPSGAPTGDVAPNTAVQTQNTSPLAASDATIDPAAAPAAPGRPSVAGAASATASAKATATAAAAAMGTATAPVAASATAAPASAVACKSRFDCKAPLVCSAGACVTPSCTGDASCGAGRYCSLEGRCEVLGAAKPVPACKSHLDCKAPLVCPAGVCVLPQCTSDSSCSAGSFCSLEGQCKAGSGH